MLSNSNTPFTMPVQPVNGSGIGNSFGGDGAWWIIILFLFIFCGWGNNGWGANGSGGVMDQYVLNSDFSTLSRQIESGFDGLRQQSTAIADGICSLGYDQLGQMNGINTNILTQSNALGTQIADLGYTMQNCCCTTQRAIDGVNYNLSTQANGITTAMQNGFCQTNYNNATNTRDIVDSQNANTRAILDKLCQMESNAKDDRIAELTAMNSDLRLAASQQAQNNYLVTTLRPSPNPAYIVQNPYCSCNYGNYGTTIA